MKQKTATISMRVSHEWKNQIKSICKEKNISITDYVISKITPNLIMEMPSLSKEDFDKLNQGVEVSNYTIPEELKTTLMPVKGLGIGAIVYNTLKNSLLYDSGELTEQKILAISCTTGAFSPIINNHDFKNK